MPGRHDGDDRPDLDDILFHPESDDFDKVAWDLFYEGVVRDHEDAYYELIEYLDYWYDIDFVDEFDWEDFDSPGVS